MSTTPSRPLDAKVFAIGVLGITACILFVGLILVSQRPAYAIGMNDRGGDYIMLTQQLSTTTEGIVVLDAAAKQMIVYNFDYNNRSLDILRRVYLDQLPKPRATDGQQTPAPRRGQ
jgi:hypothetical protein